MSNTLIVAAVKATAESVDRLMGYLSDLARIVRDCGDPERADLDLDLLDAASQCRSNLAAILDRIENSDPYRSSGNASRIMMPRHLDDLGLDQLYAIPIDPESHEQTSSMSDMYRASTQIRSPSAQSPGFPLAAPGNIQLFVTASQGLEVRP